MAIIRFEFDKKADGLMWAFQEDHRKAWPEGAYCPLGSDNSKSQLDYRGALVLWYTHVGLCIRDYENNGYHDSDFMMTVWNPEKEVVEDICFASTRGWSYPSYGSFPDATEETMKAVQKYRQGLKKKARQEKALELIRARKDNHSFCLKHGIQRPIRFRKLIKNGREDSIKQLIKANLRSEFRISLKTQLMTWLNEENPKFNSPFSPKQWNYL